MHFLRRIIHRFLNKKQQIVTENPSYSTMEAIIEDGNSFYDKADLVYFPDLKLYGAFKYDVVRDIFSNSKSITVSEIHRALNGTYFSLDESKHQHNKKIAYKHLEFLSKSLQNESNPFIDKLYKYYCSQFIDNATIDLTKELIQPIVFTSILKEYGFLQYLPEFDPFMDAYQHQICIQTIDSFFKDSQLITHFLINYLHQQKPIPLQMHQFLTEIRSDEMPSDEAKAQFFSSMIFSGTHSTVSFLSSYTYLLFSRFKELLTSPTDKSKLEKLENEVLRIYTPVQWVFRTVREKINYKGIDLNIGDTVILFVGIANLDPTFFVEPKEIKFDRTANHLAFGMGPYACIGRFATRRMAQNLVDLFKNDVEKFTLLNHQAKHYIENAIVHIPLEVKYKSS